MAFPWLAAATLGAGGLSALSGKSAADSNADLMKKILSALKGLQGEQRLAGQQALGFRQQGLGAIRGGFGRALGETSRLGQSAEIAARDEAARALGESRSALSSMGRFNPADLDFARRGISSSLMRAISENAERTAAFRAGLHTQGGLAEAGALGDLAGQTSANFGQRADLVGAGLDFQAGSAAGAYNPAQDLGWLFAGLSQLGAGGAAKAKPTVNLKKAGSSILGVL